MTTNLEKAAEVIGQLTGDGELGRNAAQAIAEHLADAGLLADDLPAPSLYAYEKQDWPMWDTRNHFRADAIDAPRVALSKAGNIWKMNPDEARALALALLAAADHAQKEETNA